MACTWFGLYCRYLFRWIPETTITLTVHNSCGPAARCLSSKAGILINWMINWGVHSLTDECMYEEKMCCEKNVLTIRKYAVSKALYQYHSWYA